MAQGDKEDDTAGGDSRKDVKTETVTETNPDGTTVTKTITTTTEEVEDEDPDLGGAFIDDAIRKKKEEEREAVQRLIDDSIRLEMAKKKIEDEYQKLKMNLEETKRKLEEEKTKNKELQTVVMVKGKGKGRKDFSSVNNEENIENKDQSDNKVVNVEDENEKIRNLQFRLKRLAEDDKAKDVTIEEMTKERVQLKRYIEELEKCVSGSKVEQIKKELIEKEKEEEKNKIQIRDRANIISHAGNDGSGGGQNKQSSVCSIM